MNNWDLRGHRRGFNFSVPSQRTAGHYYLTTQTTCTCEDAKRHASAICKHSLAVQIHCARVAGKPMPASDVVDGLTQMVAKRQGPVLDMIREPDGSIRWERHQHAGSDTFYMPRRQVTTDPTTVALAQRYSDIFGELEGD